jgi:hypothetical protein
MSNLLQTIEQFCVDRGISASGFGALALNDKAFVHQLRAGRRVWPETEAKVLNFMREFEREAT